MSKAGPTRSPARTVIGAAGAALLLAAAWLVPPLAVVVVWPLLFVLPGWVVVSWLAPRLAAPGRLGLAIVGSIALTHLVFWVSVVIGALGDGHRLREACHLRCGRAARLAGGRGAGARRLAVADRVRRAVVRHRPAFALAGLAGGFVALVLGLGLWHVTPGGVSAGGSNWSDLPVHLAIAQSLNAGNFPPQVPYFAGVPLVYHWFADFHAAIAADAAGLFAIPAMVVGSAVGAAALALCVHGLTRRLVGGIGARRVALLAVVLVVFAGGLAWTRLVGDLAAGGNAVALVTHNSYDNFWYDSAGAASWPYFRIPSVMGTGLLVHRATALGLPILVGAMLLLTLGMPTRRERAAGHLDRPGIDPRRPACWARCWRRSTSSSSPRCSCSRCSTSSSAAASSIALRRATRRCCSRRSSWPFRSPSPALTPAARGALSCSAAGSRPRGGRAGGCHLLLRHQPGRALRAGHLAALLCARDLKARCLPGCLGRRAVRHSEPDAGQ